MTTTPTGRPLGLDEDELVACVSCGLCLPHCPTYRVTGLEVASPRGRIAAMREVELRGAPVDATFVHAMDACIQCRGCEAACPSSVPFGHLMERTRTALHDGRAARRPWWRRVAEWGAYRVVLPSRRWLVALSWCALVAQRLRLVPRRLPVPPLSPATLRVRLTVPVATAPGPDAWLFTGCVMDVWQRDVHADTARVVRAAGVRIARPRPGGCCGALHEHAGRRRDAQRLARRVIASMPGTAAVLVDSAGCGAALKDYGRLLGTPEAHAFAARVRDVAEWLVERGVPTTRATGTTVVIQDPCHLRHVQRAHEPVRAMLRGAYDLVDTDDDGLCCGAGGAYSALEPELAGSIRDRKADALRRVGGDTPVVASANPGCLLHLRAAGIDARHPATLLAAALPSEDP